MSELITYLEAEKILEERIQASPDEIAQWVFNGDLPAYTNNKFKGVQPFIFRPIDYVGSDDYLGAIYELWFKLADIEAFHPKQRYISRQALLDAGVRYLGDEAKALRVITGCIKCGYLPEYHPIAGMVEIEGDLFRSGLFDVANVMEYPATKDWLKVHADKAPYVGNSIQATPIKMTPDSESKNEDVKESQLHLFIWRVYQALLIKGKRATALDVWREIEKNWPKHDEDKIIDEVTRDKIFWTSFYGNAQELKRKSFDSLFSRLKKKPPLLTKICG